MIDFLLNYGVQLFVILSSIISLIFIITKKPKILDTAFEKLLKVLPIIIKQAETKYSNGVDKKAYVLSVAFGYLSDLTGYDLERVVENYKDKISEAIEAILETPQKKGKE